MSDRRLFGMDWEKVKKVALLCTIGAFFVGIVGVVVALVWFGYSVWIQPPVPASSLPGRWEFPPMKAWLPSLIIGIGLVLAAIFNVIAVFMSRHSLKKQLATANAAFADASETNEKLAADLSSANLAIGEGTKAGERIQERRRRSSQGSSICQYSKRSDLDGPADG
jgi:uncharacterized integral membrane protein